MTTTAAFDPMCPAIILPASKEWAYDDIEADFKTNPLIVWREVSESFYWQALEVLPPIYSKGGFMVSEAWSHTADNRPLYAGFAEVGSRHFATISTVADFPAKREYLTRCLAKEADLTRLDDQQLEARYRVAASTEDYDAMRVIVAEQGKRHGIGATWDELHPDSQPEA